MRYVIFSLMLLCVHGCKNQTPDSPAFFTGRFSALEGDSVVAEGWYTDGFKSGVWQYHLAEEYRIDWMVAGDTSITFNLPKSFDTNRLNDSGYLSVGSLAKTEFEIVVMHTEIAQQDVLLSDYAERMTREFNEYYAVHAIDFQNFIQGDIPLIIGHADIERSEVVQRCFVMLAKTESGIAEVSCYFNNTETNDLAFEVFADVFTSLKVNGDFIIDHTQEGFRPGEFVRTGHPS